MRRNLQIIIIIIIYRVKIILICLLYEVLKLIKLFNALLLFRDYHYRTAGFVFA